MEKKVEYRKEYIDLAHAHITQQDVGRKSDWIVQKNITFEELGRFNGSISDDDVRKMLKFAQKYELIAFNAGINFQKEISNKLMEDMKKDFNTRIKIIAAENERLSSVLMKHIGDPEDLKQNR